MISSLRWTKETQRTSLQRRRAAFVWILGAASALRHFSALVALHPARDDSHNAVPWEAARPRRHAPHHMVQPAWHVTTRASLLRPVPPREHPPEPLAPTRTVAPTVAPMVHAVVPTLAPMTPEAPHTTTRSSLERLWATVPFPNVTRAPTVSSSAASSSILPNPARRLLFVNCAAAGTAPSDASPRSLSQCHALVHQSLQTRYNDTYSNVIVTIPRTDLFRAPNEPSNHHSALTLPQLQPLGALHFHARLDSNRRRISSSHDVKWFLAATTKFDSTDRPVYFRRLGHAVQQAAAHQSPPSGGPSWTVPATGALASVLSSMYQTPSDDAKDTSVIPSVGVYRYAFVEVNTSRLLLHIPLTTPSVNDSTTTPVQHAQVLIQLNSCNVPAALNATTAHEVPFARTIPATTVASRIPHVRTWDTAIFIGALWAWDFYHATIEHVPRLLLLRDFIDALDPSIPIVVAKSHKGCLLQHYAHLWGLGHRMVRLRLDEVLYARTLYIPEPSPCLALQPSMAQAYRHAIQQWPVLDTEDDPSGRRTTGATLVAAAPPTMDLASNTSAPVHGTDGVPLSTRSVATPVEDWIVVIRRRRTRYLRNHDDLLSALQTNFPNETWFVFDEDNVQSPGPAQWNLFRRAKLVIAPHGAGLSHLVACRPGTHVVEFLGWNRDFELCFLHLALALSLHYHPLGMNHRIIQRKTSSYTVDVPHVVHVVRDILTLVW